MSIPDVKYTFPYGISKNGVKYILEQEEDI